ncbi:MAG TPA: ATP-binding protein [Ohtaekwangia sp.]|nr:ATP-binding protein [Ohtaekwangia sp.]
MLFRNAPIKKKIQLVIMLTSGVILLLMFASYFIYEFITFRQTAVQNISVQAKIIASNSTAALAFESREEGHTILSALKADRHIIAAALYDKEGALFSKYQEQDAGNELPKDVKQRGHKFEDAYLIFFEPVVENNHVLGTLYLKSDMDALYDRLIRYAVIAAILIAMSLVVAYLLSMRLQKSISQPVLALAETAKAVSQRKDYTVRATKYNEDEIGLLTEAFNQMLSEIELQNIQIQRFNQELESTIRQRTDDLQTANKELESFSYSVSHDLRAPLRSINGFARILLEDYGETLDPEGIRSLHTIIRNGERMGQLIDDLLAFSRLGKQQVTKVLLDSESIVKNVIEELNGQYGDQSEIHVKSLPDIYGDSSMLKQVFQNLISNALKYSMKKEKPVIEIGGYTESFINTYYVKDNGAGFKMQYYDKLFGVFQRLHNTSEFEGTGVGLALVHRIITRHGGKIWAEAEENKGATFYFSLPLNKNHKA